MHLPVSGYFERDAMSWILRPRVVLRMPRLIAVRRVPDPLVVFRMLRRFLGFPLPKPFLPPGGSRVAVLGGMPRWSLPKERRGGPPGGGRRPGGRL